MLRRSVLVGDQVLGRGITNRRRHFAFSQTSPARASARHTRRRRAGWAAQTSRPAAATRHTRVPFRQHAHVESAVAGHQQPFRAVLLQSLFSGDKHRHLRAVFRREEHLLQFVLAGVERNFRLRKDFALARQRIEPVNRGRRNERFKAIEAVAVGGASRESGRQPDAVVLHACPPVCRPACRRWSPSSHRAAG